MIRWLIALAALLLTTAPVEAPGAAPATAPQVEITVSRAGNGEWSIDYRFNLPSPVWFFPRSGSDRAGKSWRAQSWRVETPGVTLDRTGVYDTLSGDVPLTHVRIRMTPYVAALPNDYTPALRFSDGSLAFFTDHFALLPGRSLSRVRALPYDLAQAALPEPQTSLSFRDPGRRLMLRGVVSTGSASMPLTRGNTYVYAGDVPLIDTPAFAGVIDTGLPLWIRTELSSFVPRLMAIYTREFGPSSVGRPMAMAAWEGKSEPGWFLGGGVVDGMVVMQISGKGVVKREPEALDRMRWFVGHEAAHFWLGQTVRTQYGGENWITEGGADFLATRALEELLPFYDPFEDLRRAMDVCLASIGPGESLAGAEERGDLRAPYACGMLLALAAEHATKQRYPEADSYEFIRGLIAANRRDRTVTAQDWFARFRQVTRNPALTDDVRSYVTKGSGDPKAFFRRLFLATGVPLAVEEIPVKEKMRR